MARPDLKVELLSNVPLFAACNRNELKRIASLADEIEVPAGKVLCKEGAPGREFFVIAEGQATATLRRKKVATFGPGNFFGEMAILDHQPRSATITTESPTRLFVVDIRSFGQLLEDAPNVAKKIMRGIAQRLREVEKAPTH